MRIDHCVVVHVVWGDRTGRFAFRKNYTVDSAAHHAAASFGLQDSHKERMRTDVEWRLIQFDVQLPQHATVDTHVSEGATLTLVRHEVKDDE